MGTAPIVCTHCILEIWTYSPARARRPYWRDLARQVFAITFPRVLGRGPRAVRKTLIGVCLDSCVNLDLWCWHTRVC